MSIVKQTNKINKNLVKIRSDEAVKAAHFTVLCLYDIMYNTCKCWTSGRKAL